MIQEHAVDEPLPAEARPPEPEAREEPPAPVVQTPCPPATPSETDLLLRSILDQLRRMQKNEMFREFSLMRLLAGIIQVFVPFCVLLALWFLTGSRREDNSVFLALSFAAVLQLMALTFYIMHGRR